MECNRSFFLTLFIATLTGIAAQGAMELLVQQEVAKVAANLKRELTEALKNMSSCCQTNWLVYGGHRYFISEEKKSWQDAQNDCLLKKANLVKIDDASENQWIKSVLKNDIWIGLNDLQVSRNWKWVSDNSPLVYSNWNRHEPSHPTEQCVHMWKDFSYNWNDHTCSALRGYMCETNL